VSGSTRKPVSLVFLVLLENLYLVCFWFYKRTCIFPVSGSTGEPVYCGFLVLVLDLVLSCMCLVLQENLCFADKVYALS